MVMGLKCEFKSYLEGEAEGPGTFLSLILIGSRLAAGRKIVVPVLLMDPKPASGDGPFVIRPDKVPDCPSVARYGLSVAPHYGARYLHCG